MSATYPKPPPLDPNLEANGPDFALIGAQKSGTTRLWSLLRNHPQFFVDDAVLRFMQPTNSRFMSPKERNFFADTCFQFSNEHVSLYKSWFAKPGGYVTADFTPYYLTNYWVPAQFFECVPACRIVVMLRDPVGRFISGLGHVISNRHSLNQNLINVHFLQSLYFQALQRWLAYYPRDAIMVMQYEQFNSDPLASLRKIMKFVGIDDNYEPTPAMLAKRINPTGEFKPKLTARQHRSIASALERDTSQLLQEFPELDADLWNHSLD